MSEETKRYLLDYYIKGLDLTVQRTIWEKVADGFTDKECGFLLDAKNGYETVFKSGVYRSRQEIEPFLKQQEKKFVDINDYMKRHKRNPLFENPLDLEASAETRNKLVSFLPESECNKIVGCESFLSHTPPVYKEGPESAECEKQKWKK